MDVMQAEGASVICPPAMERLAPSIAPKAVSASRPEPLSLPLSPEGAATREAEIGEIVDRILREVSTSAAGRERPREIRREDLLLHLLREPGDFGREAFDHLKSEPQRLRDELLRVLGETADVPSRERPAWPIARWLWIAAAVGSVGYPLSIGPVILILNGLGLKNMPDHVIEVVYAPIVWLYETVPWVEAFYDWYLGLIGLN